MPSYLVQEEDGTSRLILEETGGDLLLEESVADINLGPGECGLELEDGAGLLMFEDETGLLLLEACAEVVPVRHVPASGITYRPQVGDDEDALAVALALLLR